MTDAEKQHFDRLNKYTYLFRLVAKQNGLTIVMQELADGQCSYHLCYEDSVLASIAITDDDIGINIYKYFRVLSKKVKDVYITDFFTPDHFLFKDFSEYCQTLKNEYDHLDANSAHPEESSQENSESSLVDELKKENLRLRLELDTYKSNIFNLFMRI